MIDLRPKPIRYVPTSRDLGDILWASRRGTKQDRDYVLLPYRNGAVYVTPPDMVRFGLTERAFRRELRRLRRTGWFKVHVPRKGTATIQLLDGV